MNNKKNSERKTDSVARESESVLENSVSELRRIFPEAVTESGKIDFDKLRLTLGDEIESETSL
jgi:hypothetical protein